MSEESHDEEEKKNRKNNLTMEKKLAFGKAFYGNSFTGFQKVGELRAALPAFKDLYYTRKTENTAATTRGIVMEYNEKIAPERFHPWPTQLKFWTSKWDRHILEQMGMKDASLVKKGEVYQVIKTRAQDRVLAYGVPEDQALEEGVRTLGGELINDAMQMLRDDQELEEIYDTDELIKRRNYVVNVFGYATRMVQGKAALLLKASQEKRETAGFLMELMREAAAGKLTKDKLDVLKSSVTPTPPPVQYEQAHTG